MSNYPNPDCFHLALAAWMKEKKYSSRLLAEAAGLHLNTIETYRRLNPKRRSIPGLYAMVCIAEALGITVEDLLRGPHNEGMGVNGHVNA